MQLKFDVKIFRQLSPCIVYSIGTEYYDIEIPGKNEETGEPNRNTENHSKLHFHIKINKKGNQNKKLREKNYKRKTSSVVFSVEKCTKGEVNGTRPH